MYAILIIFDIIHIVGEYMKKVILILSIILLTGCSIERLDNKSIDGVITTMLSTKIKYTNTVGRGYEYYLPMGVSRQKIDSFNEQLYSDGDVYYLFIDVVGYLNKTKISATKEKNAYFYKELDDKGYINILEADNKYFVKIYYNYSYIESYVQKGNISISISNMLMILKSIKYSDNILTLGKNSELISNFEEKFSIKSKDKPEINFLDYEQKYDKYEEPDIDIIQDNNNSNNNDIENDIITKDDE